MGGGGRKQTNKYQRLDDAVQADNQTFVDAELGTRQELMERQDEDLTEVSHVVRNLHSMGKEMNRELDAQANLLNDFDDEVDTVGGRLKRTMAKLDNLSDKIKDGGSMCCIVFLVLVLVVLLVLIIKL